MANTCIDSCDIELAKLGQYPLSTPEKTYASLLCNELFPVKEIVRAILVKRSWGIITGKIAAAQLRLTEEEYKIAWELFKTGVKAIVIMRVIRATRRKNLKENELPGEASRPPRTAP